MKNFLIVFNIPNKTEIFKARLFYKRTKIFNFFFILTIFKSSCYKKFHNFHYNKTIAKNPTWTQAKKFALSGCRPAYRRQGIGYHVARCFSIYNKEKPFASPTRAKQFALYPLLCAGWENRTPNLSLEN